MGAQAVFPPTGTPLVLGTLGDVLEVLRERAPGVRDVELVVAGDLASDACTVAPHWLPVVVRPTMPHGRWRVQTW